MTYERLVQLVRDERDTFCVRAKALHQVIGAIPAQTTDLNRSRQIGLACMSLTPYTENVLASFEQELSELQLHIASQWHTAREEVLALPEG